MAPWEEYLKKIYFDPSHPGSFSGPQKLYKVVKSEGKYDIGIHRIRKFLHNQEAYSLHKQQKDTESETERIKRWVEEQEERRKNAPEIQIIGRRY